MGKLQDWARVRVGKEETRAASGSCDPEQWDVGHAGGGQRQIPGSCIQQRLGTQADLHCVDRYPW